METAENIEQAEADLATVTAAIIDIQTLLNNANARHSVEEKNLRDAEKDIAAVAQSAAAAQRLLGETGSELELLHRRIDRLENKRRQHSVLLAESIRAAYMVDERSALKLLLNPQDLSRSARLFHYHRLFAESRIEKIEAFQNTLADISKASIELEFRLLGFANQQSELEQKLLTLNAARTRREQAVSELTASISSRSGELEQLEINQAELLKLQALLVPLEKKAQRLADDLKENNTADYLLKRAFNLIEEVKQDIKELEYAPGRINDTKYLDLTIGKKIQTIKDLLIKAEKIIYISS